MIKRSISVWLAAGALGAMLATPVQAQVRDAEYRGTLVCEKLPFAADPTRVAIAVNIVSNEGSYERPVFMSGRGKLAGTEKGTAKVDGEKISLAGGWKGDKDSYEASYSGGFVRRSANLTGTQKWTHDGQSFTRNCTGSIKRPLAAFLPKARKPPQ